MWPIQLALLLPTVRRQFWSSVTISNTFCHAPTNLHRPFAVPFFKSFKVFLLRNIIKFCIRITGSPAELQTQYLQNTSLDTYCYTHVQDGKCKLWEEVFYACESRGLCGVAVGEIPFFWDRTLRPLGNLDVREECGHSSLTCRPLKIEALCTCQSRKSTGFIFQNSGDLKLY